MAEQLEWNVSTKEIILYVPIVGGTIAAVYDVGYFSALGISFFSLFSLSEHLVFAIQASPFALLATLVVGLILTARHLDIFQKYVGRSLHIFGFGFVVLAMILFTINFQISSSILMGVGYILFFLSPVIGRAPRAIYFIALIGGGFTAVLFIGTSLAERKLQSSATEIIQIKGEGRIEGTLIRSGDRGILFFDYSMKSIRFRQWNDVIQIAHRVQ
jgi:hypothetical protein